MHNISLFCCVCGRGGRGSVSRGTSQGQKWLRSRWSEQDFSGCRKNKVSTPVLLENSRFFKSFFTHFPGWITLAQTRPAKVRT